MTSHLVPPHLVIVAPLPALHRRTRLAKVAKFYAKAGFKLSFWGWERVAGEASAENVPQSDTQTKTLLHGGGYSSSAAWARYPLWSLQVFRHCMRLPSTSVVWALGLETALPAVLASRLKGFRVIFDDADRFLLLKSFPPAIYRAIRALEINTSKNAALHVIPGEERYDYESPSFMVVKNMPSKSEVENLTLPAGVEKSAALCVYVNGWLGAGRGMGPIFQAARELLNEPVRFIVAGRVDCEAARELIALPNVHYLGELPNREALAYYQVADFVFTYYDPKVPINRYAEANKWGDAIVLGVPVIVNEEVVTGRFLLEAGGGRAFAYEDVAGLARFLSVCGRDRALLEPMKSAMVTLSQKHGFFEESLEIIRGRLVPSPQET